MYAVPRLSLLSEVVFEAIVHSNKCVAFTITFYVIFLLHDHIR